MKLDYKILWLDDKIDVIIEDQYIAEVKDYLVEEGFNPIIVTSSNEVDFFKKLDGTFDLILTDYHLNETVTNTRNGDAIIKEIREKNIFTEIMFYSAQGEVVDTTKMDRITFVDTKKSTKDHNDTVIERAKALIDLTIKKFQHIVAMRGLIMNETSSLDLQMLDIINEALKNQSISFEELATKIYEDLITLYSTKTKLVNDCKDAKKFSNLTKDTFVFSAEYKIRTLGQILKSLKIEDFSEAYGTEINLIRNKFAHATLLKDADGREYFKHGDSGLTFDEDLCKKIRKNIAKHKNNFDQTKLKVSVHKK